MTFLYTTVTYEIKRQNVSHKTSNLGSLFSQIVKIDYYNKGTDVYYNSIGLGILLISEKITSMSVIFLKQKTSDCPQVELGTHLWDFPQLSHPPVVLYQ